MSAPEYLIKLKFSTETDKKAFAEIQNTYNKLGEKQKKAFAKNYNTTVQDLNKIFQKETNKSLKEYEKSAIKTEKVVYEKRMENIKKVATKQKTSMQQFGKFAGSIIAGVGAGAILNGVLANNYSLTPYTKNLVKGGVSGGITGLMLGAQSGNIYAAIGGLIAGAVGGTWISDLQNSADKMQKGSTLFYNSVQKYTSLLNFTSPLDTTFETSNFKSVGEFMTYQNVIGQSNLNNDMVKNFLLTLASTRGSEKLGRKLVASSEDDAIMYLQKAFKESGKTDIDFLSSLGLTDKRSIATGRKILSFDYAQVAQEQVQKGVKFGAFDKMASEYDEYVAINEKRRKDFESNTFWQTAGQVRRLHDEDINMNNTAVLATASEFERLLIPMRQHELLLQGVNKLYESFEKEMYQVMNHISNVVLGHPLDVYTPLDYDKPIKRDTEAIKGVAALWGGRMDRANQNIRNTRAENRPDKLESF